MRQVVNELDEVPFVPIAKNWYSAVSHNLPAIMIGPAPKAYANERRPCVHFDDQAAIGMAAEKFQMDALLIVRVDSQARPLVVAIEDL
jgi:hypothetical protein